MHEDGGIDAHDVVVEFGHRVPPVAFDVVFQFDAHLAVVIYGAQAIVYFARRKDESVLLAVGNQLLEEFFLCHMCLFVIACLATACV